MPSKQFNPELCQDKIVKDNGYASLENDTFHVQRTAKDVYKRLTCYVRGLSLVVVGRILIGRKHAHTHTHTHTLTD